MKELFNKLNSKYGALSLPVKASFWFTVCSILQKGISMITVPLFTRMLTLEQYGEFSVYQSWYSIISIFATLNFSCAVYNNGMIKYKEHKNQFTSSVQTLSTIITVFLFTIYLMNRSFFENLLGLSSIFICTIFLQLLVEPAYLFWCSRQRFEYKYKTLVAITLVISFMSPFLGIIAVLSTEYKAEARIISYAFIQICVGLIFYIINCYRGRVFYSLEYWKFVLKFNIPLIPHYLSGMILGQSDRIMINNMIGAEEAAIYSVAYNMSQLMFIFINAVNNSLVPYTYQKMEEKNYRSINKICTDLLGILMIGSFVMMLFGPELIMLFAAPTYFDARWIVPSVVASIFFVFLYPLFANIEFYFEQSKYVTIASIVGAIVNVILNWILIPIFGYIVAGYTTLISYIVYVVMHYVFMRKILKQRLNGTKIYDIKKILGISLIMILLMGITTFLYISLWMRYAVIVIIFILVVLKRRNIYEKIRAVKK